MRSGQSCPPTRLFQYSSDKADLNAHFWFDGQWIDEGNWANLHQAGKSVLPVILSYQRGEEWAFPGELHLASLTGDSPKTVRRGIKELSGFPNFDVVKYRTRRGMATKFRHRRKRRKDGIEFPFFARFFTGGNWFLLKPAAKALYPVMRHKTYFDLAEYEENLNEQEAEEYEDGYEFYNDFETAYPKRGFDLCDSGISELCDLAGIHRNSFNNAVEDLERHAFVERFEQRFGFKVFLRPPYHWKPKVMNSLVRKRFLKYADKY